MKFRRRRKKRSKKVLFSLKSNLSCGKILTVRKKERKKSRRYFGALEQKRSKKFSAFSGFMRLFFQSLLLCCLELRSPGEMTEAASLVGSFALERF